MPTPEPSERLERRVLQICNATGSLVEHWGFKSIHGRLWTLLALRAAPMPQTEIADTLGVSRSLVSSTMTELVEYGLVRATNEHRNAPYAAVMNVWPVISDVLRQREWMLLETARMSIESTQEEVELSPSSHYDPSRMKLLNAMIESVQRLLRLVVSIRMPDTAGEVQEWISNVSMLIESLSGSEANPGERGG